jgi:hypothetical protein
MHRPALRHRAPRQVRLSPRQQAVVAKMRQGWTLYERVGGSGDCWLVREGMTETVSIATVRVLARCKIVVAEQEASPRYRYRLINRVEPCSTVSGITVEQGSRSAEALREDHSFLAPGA